MKVVVFETFLEQTIGLQYKKIEPGTLYVFPGIYEGDFFHSRNVREDFDIAFLSADLTVLRIERVHPPAGTATAPKGTRLAVEAKAGEMGAWSFVPGKVAFYGASPKDGVSWPGH